MPITAVSVNDRLTKLIPALKAGDEFAFEELYGILWRPMLGATVNFLGPKYAHYAEDIVQEVIIKISLAIKHFRSESGGLQVWVWKILRNHSYDRVRKLQCRKSDFTDSLEDHPDLFDQTFEPIECLKSQELRKLLITAFNQFDESTRSIMILILDGYSLEEAKAQICPNTNPNTCKVRLFRARVFLRSFIRQDPALSTYAQHFFA